MDRLLKIKLERKKNRPKFARHDSNVRKQFKSWRKPRGMHNKLRMRVRGHMNPVKQGYGSPLRFIDKHGLKLTLVRNPDELKKLNPKEHSVIIGNIGLKKKMVLVKKCNEIGFRIVNIKDVSKFLEEKNSLIESRKKLRKERHEKKEKSKKELEKKAMEKEQKPEEAKKDTTEEKIKEDMKKRLPGDRK